MLKAINKKHQSKVNKAVRRLISYNSYNNLRDMADGNGDDKAYKTIDRICGRLFNEYLEIIGELPSREIKQIESSKYY